MIGQAEKLGLQAKKCKDQGCKSTTFYSSTNIALVNSNQTAMIGVYATEHAESQQQRQCAHIKKEAERAEDPHTDNAE